MTPLKRIAIAVCLAVGAVAASSVFVPEVVQAAEARAKISRAVGVPLQKAKEAMDAKDWDTALAEIQKAQAVEKKAPHEEYQIDEFLAFVLVQQQKFGEAAPVYERMISSGLMPQDQVNVRTKAVAQMYFQVKDYRKAADWAQKWLDSYGMAEDMGVLLGLAYYGLEDFQNAAAALTRVVDHIEQSNEVPKEDYLRYLFSSYVKLQDRPGIENSLKRTVRHYPKPEYWDDLLEIYRRKSNSDRVTFGFYRLMNTVGVLKDKGEYMEMAQLGIEMGVPGESEKVMQQGVDKGILKSDDKAEQSRFERLLADSKKQAAADRASLAQQAKEAEKSPKGQADVGLGEAYLSYGQYEEAIAAIERGIKKGGVNDVDEAQISLGIAYLESGQKEKAREAFKAVKPGSRWADLAELWDLHAQSVSS
ncbi:MAG TPA: tetratricopeptide repeat protein [Steroidobacteraceae bacterium]